MRNNTWQVEYLPLCELKHATWNAHTHSKAQVAAIRRSIERFEFITPILVDDRNTIIAGHARVSAPKATGLVEAPCLRVSHLSDAEIRAFTIADNRLAEKADWDQGILAIEFQGLLDLGFELELTGFTLPEIELALSEAAEASPEDPEADEADDVPEPQSVAVSRPGDLWRLGRHLLLCGDARDEASYTRLMDEETADMVFTDPPYTVAIAGVTGLGRTKHREFVCASGEMSEAEFTSFLTTTLSHASRVCRDGTIAFICSDRRHLGEMHEAGRSAFTELKNLCVWTKTNGGMGTFYRSKHELVFVWKVGTEPHVNTFGLGDKGRYRTNVWAYAGVNTFKAERIDELSAHPTVKPVAPVADAIRDVSHRGQIVLDPFGGSGTTLIAAQKTGRIARLIELDPLYCDVIIRRFERVTRKAATHSSNGESFERIALARAGRRGSAVQAQEISSQAYIMGATMTDRKKPMKNLGNYEVGYGRPPVATRFKPGQSGNRYRRPPKEQRAATHRQIRQDILREMEAMTTVTIEGRPQQVPMIVLIVRQLMLRAAKGDLRAIEKVLALRESVTNAQVSSNPGLYQFLQEAEAHILNKPEPPLRETRKVLNQLRHKTREV